MKRFEVIDVSGDAGIRAFGRDLRELFSNSAFGMYSLVTDPDGIEEVKTIDMAVESDTIGGLLVSWLNELIFLFDARGFIGRKIVIEQFPGADAEGRGPLMLKASVAGEEFDPERHERKLLVKAATYHRLKIERAGDIWQAEVIFDI